MSLLGDLLHARCWTLPDHIDALGATVWPNQQNLSISGTGSTADTPPKAFDEAEPSFFHVDHLGSVRVETDLNGTLMTRRDFYPFGREMTAAASENGRRFTGHERDVAVGMDYMLARHYAPSAARFLSVDPADSEELSEPQSWNRYTYAANSPLNYLDPDGQFGGPIHTQIGIEAGETLDEGLGVAKVDHLLGTPLPLDAVVHPWRHFGPEKKGEARIDRYLDKAAEAWVAGDYDKARRYAWRAYHLSDDRIAHRDFDGRPIGYFEHGLRKLADAFIKGCKFSPDCDKRPDFDKKKQEAVAKRKERKQQ